MNEDAKSWHHVGCEKDERQLLICAELLKRMIENNDEKFSNGNFKKHDEQMHQCQELLGQIIGKHMMSWWD